MSTALALQSASRAATACAPKPEKIGTAIAPILAHARNEITASGIIGRNSPIGIALPDAEALERIGKPASLGVKLAVRQPANDSVLSFRDDGNLIAPRRLGMPVKAMMGQVDRAAAKPRRPGDPAARIQDGIERPIKLNLQILDRRLPEPLDLVGGSRNQLPVRGESDAGA